MKKIIFLGVLLWISLFNNQLFGATTEENTCISELSNAIKQDNRFSDSKIFINNKGLKNILYDAATNTTADVSSYSKFVKNAVINPLSSDKYHKNLIKNNGFTNKDFIARRTNIATVITSSGFVVSNVVGFGKDSNFTFPLPAKSGKIFGDAYDIGGNPFKEYVLYSHHSIKGAFLSCGLVHIVPLGTKINGKSRGYGDISGSGYYSNVLSTSTCSSGFTGNNISKKGFNFYKMKTNVCVIGKDKKDYLKMEILSLAYKNNSSYFSDYVAYNLQVSAMKNKTNQQKGLIGIRRIFEKYLFEGTCSELVHTSTGTLSSFCGGVFSDKFDISKININNIIEPPLVLKLNGVKNNITGLFDIILPKVNAARVFENMDKMIEESRGLRVIDDMPYELYVKLKNIKNNYFRQYLELSISPFFEESIVKRRNNNILITPYEDIFLKCNIKYPERNAIVIDFLKNLKDPQNIDFSNLSYSNTKFGDCIVPYPDKKNIDQKIDLSFDSNKRLVDKIDGIYKYSKPSEKILKLIEKENIINSKYEQKLNSLTKQFNSNEISSDELKKAASKEQASYEQQIKNIRINLEKEQQIKKEINKQINKELTIISEKNDNFDRKTLIIIISLILIGTLVLFLSIRRRK